MTRQNGNQGKGGGLRAFLESPDVKSRLAQVASAAMKPEDLVRLTLIAASRQPELLRCSQHSILRALLDAAALGIKPGGLMGRGYLVPRQNRHTKELEAIFDPGWRGLVDIARRSGTIKRIESHVVHEEDVFNVVRSPLTTVHHEPSELADPGGIRAAYAVCEFMDGSIQIEVLWKRDLDKIRATSAARQGPWQTWPEEMARKSAVRRLCKYLPFDPMLERGLEVALAAEREDAAPPMDLIASAPEPAKPTLANKIRAKREERKSEPRGVEIVSQEPQEPQLEIDPETGEVVPPPNEDETFDHG